MGGRRELVALAMVTVACTNPPRGATDSDPPYDDNKAYSAFVKSASVVVPNDVSLPEATGTGALQPTDPVVVIARDSLRFPLSDLRIDLPADKTHGVDAKEKRSGSPNDLYITKLGSVLRWARDKDKQTRLQRGDDASGSTLTVLADRETPYRLLVEVLFTAGQSEFDHFNLAVRSGQQLEAIATSPPKPRKANPQPSAPALGLTILVVDGGFSVKAVGGNVAPGCADTGPGLAVGKTPDGKYDFDGLNKCVAHVKSAEFADETTMTIAASPAIPQHVVVSTIQAVRKTEGGRDLFREVQFGIAR